MVNSTFTYYVTFLSLLYLSDKILVFQQLAVEIVKQIAIFTLERQSFQIKIFKKQYTYFQWSIGMFVKCLSFCFYLYMCLLSMHICIPDYVFGGIVCECVCKYIHMCVETRSWFGIRSFIMLHSIQRGRVSGRTQSGPILTVLLTNLL